MDREETLQHQQPRYHFTNGIFTFWIAQYGSINYDARTVFRVREDTHPKTRAREKLKPGWGRLYLASPSEIAIWLADHPTYPILKITPPLPPGKADKEAGA
jgi:hypothetical protein